MRRITVGLTGFVALGVTLCAAPLLWSQAPRDATPSAQRQEPAGELHQPVPPPRQGGDGPPAAFPGPGLPQPPVPPVIQTIDADGDGEISAAELQNAPTALEKLDQNGDGELTLDELMPALPGFLPGGPGFGGPGGPMGQERKLVKDFDQDGDGRLNVEERKAARNSLAESGGNRGPGGFRFDPPVGFDPGRNREPGGPGPKVSPNDVAFYPDVSLYEPTVLRTLFLEFENEDWEAELAVFKDSDVEVPAQLIVDGKTYPNIGVRFRGMSSFMMVPAGLKRSLNLSLDFVDANQRLYGYKTLNLLNCAGDSSMMSTVLYSHIARQYIPAPKANFVKVVINGESWGVYANAQQFNKEFLAENFESDKGARWKAEGSPNADGGLRYLGENIDEYRRRYGIKSNDSKNSWNSLIALCRTLDETPTDQLEQALTPILDIDSLLWFLALDVTLVNSDGYWARASDYSIFRDNQGKFHIIPHDMNEAFHGSAGHGPGGPGFGPGGPGFGPGGPGFGPGGPGFGPGGPGFGPGGPGFGPGGPGFGPGGPGFGPGGPGFGPGGPGFHEGGVSLDPLVALDDVRKPLRSKVLAVPSLRQKYLQHVRTLAETSLDWDRLGPVAAQFRSLIEQEVEADTRKLTSLEAFLNATSDREDEGGDRGEISLRSFAERRCKFLLEHPEIAALPRGSR